MAPPGRTIFAGLFFSSPGINPDPDEPVDGGEKQKNGIVDSVPPRRLRRYTGQMNSGSSCQREKGWANCREVAGRNGRSA